MTFSKLNRCLWLFRAIAFASFGLIYILPRLAGAQSVDITVTDSLILSRTEFYSQSSSGNLFTCGVEFDGTDSKLNHFAGSYGFMHFDKRGTFPLLKLISHKINDDRTAKRLTITSAWLKTPTASTLTAERWVSDPKGDSFLLIGRDVATGVKLYRDLISGEETMVGYLHPGERIDRVYRLAAFSASQYEASRECLLKLLK